MAVLENKKIIKYCPNYYKIVNQEINEKDAVGIKLIQIYQEYVFSIDIEDKRSIKNIKELSNTIVKYFSDGDFKKEIITTITTLKVKKDTNNVIDFIVEKLIETYNKYLEYYTRNLYIPRWI